MAFDSTNPNHLLVMKNEFANDPENLGYQAVIGSTTLIRKLLNDPANNPGGETAQVTLTSETLIQALDVTEYGSNQMGNNRGFIDTIIAFGTSRGGTPDLEQFRAKIEGAFPAGNSATRDALTAQQRALSRAEAMEDPAVPGTPIYGPGTDITKSDVVAVLAS